MGRSIVLPMSCARWVAVLLVPAGLVLLLSSVSAGTTQQGSPSSASPAKRTSSKDKPTTRRSAKRTVTTRRTSRAANSKTSPKRAGSKSGHVIARRGVPPAPVAQNHPTKDRYIEIQQALARAGYFEGPVNGVWDGDSVKALESFQSSQGLDATGKIDAPTLIRLDLGPNYDQPEAAKPAAVPPPG